MTNDLKYVFYKKTSLDKNLIKIIIIYVFVKLTDFDWNIQYYSHDFFNSL